MRSSRPPTPARSATARSGSPRSSSWCASVPVSVTPTPSEGRPGVAPADALREARAAIVARPGLVGVALRDALADAYDEWLRAALPARSGIALVAVGGLGRREMAPYSDLDLMLLHAKGAKDVAAAADAIWYPVW